LLSAGVVLLLAASCSLVGEALKMKMRASPIRRVLNMLQMMEKKVEERGEEEDKVFDDFACYCKRNLAALDASIAAAREKIPQLESTLEDLSAEQKQLEQDFKTLEAERTAAKQAIDEATEIRNNEREVFERESTDLKNNIDALKGAIEMMDKVSSRGGSASLLQASTLSWLQSFSQTVEVDRLRSNDRDLLLAFLKQPSDTTASLDEIVGILSQMQDEMKEDLASMKEEETNKQAAFLALMQGKQKQIAALTSAIDQKEERYSAVKVQISEVSRDLSDTKEALASDEKLRAELSKECDERKAAYAVTKKDLADEMTAITQTVKILSDDDAQDLFRKTVPGPDAAASFVQVGSTRARRRAVWKTLRQLQTLSARHPGTAAVFRQEAASVSASGDIPDSFAKLSSLITRMVAVLGKEQEDDDLKKQMCTAELRRKTDHKTALHEKIAGKTAEFESTMSQMRTAEKDIEMLTQGIAELDAAVSDATKQRKEAHAYFVTVLAENNAATEVLQKAKDRLDAFYKGKSKDTSVIHMISMIQEDIGKEVSELKSTEASDQQDYEELLEASAEKRETDARAITERSAAQAGLDEESKVLKKKVNMREEELGLTEKVIANLHTECDWLLEKYEERSKLRAEEVEALKKTESTLKGADYSSLIERAKKTRRPQASPADEEQN
jgi:chromosome segregation ATPase